MTKKTVWMAAVALPVFLAGGAQAQSTTSGPGTGYVAPNAPVPGSSPSQPSATGFVAPSPGTPGTNTNGSDSTPAPDTGMASSAPSDLSAADKKFIQKAAVGGEAEVQLAQLAEQKTQDPTVKQFAEKMITDHTPNNEQLAKLASSKGVTAPAELDAMHQKQMARLQSLSGKKFDTAYLKEQEKAHDVMLKLFKIEAKSGHDPELKQFAETTIPVIEEHEHLAESDLK